jgi:hypothetical protein
MPSQGTQTRPRILLMADAPSLVHILTGIFALEELEVESVPSLPAALERLREEGRFTTLLVDERSTGVREALLRTQLAVQGIRVPVIMLPHSLDVSALLPRLHLMPAIGPDHPTVDRTARFRQFALGLALTAGTAATLLFMLELDWRLGWLPVMSAPAVLRSRLAHDDEAPLSAGRLEREALSPTERLELYLLTFFTGLFVWLVGMTLV